VPRILLLLAIAGAIYLLLRRAQSVPPHKRRAEYTKLGLTLAVVVVIALTLTGRMHWIGAALTGLLVAARQLLPSLVRLFPVLASMHASRAQARPQGRQSTVESDLLRMHLDHDSGQLSGEVLKGPFKDWRLHDLDRSQLEVLFNYCQANDSDSLQLLESYLEQRFPGAAPFGSPPPPPDSDSGMSEREALAVLGLEEGAAPEEIIAAHRKLMQKLHPDRGGNDYLAAKINQAKDLLLG
jgi:hypothetical protein